MNISKKSYKIIKINIKRYLGTFNKEIIKSKLNETD